MQMQAKYPETEYKRMEEKLTVAEQKVVWWEKQVPKAIARELKIEALQDRVKELELKVKDVQHEAATQKLFDKQKLDVKDSRILMQRALLEKHEQAGGYSRQGAQLWAAFHEQNYDRATKIANSAGPYNTPEKEKPPREHELEGNVVQLELAKIIAQVVNDINVIDTSSEAQDDYDAENQEQPVSLD